MSSAEADTRRKEEALEACSDLHSTSIGAVLALPLFAALIDLHRALGGSVFSVKTSLSCRGPDTVLPGAV